MTGREERESELLDRRPYNNFDACYDTWWSFKTFKSWNYRPALHFVRQFKLCKHCEQIFLYRIQEPWTFSGQFRERVNETDRLGRLRERQKERDERGRNDVGQLQKWTWCPIHFKLHHQGRWNKCVSSKTKSPYKCCLTSNITINTHTHSQSHTCLLAKFCEVELCCIFLAGCSVRLYNASLNRTPNI